MTDREKAIVMAYTGTCMLMGDKFQIFHKYVEDIMGRPIWTHELGIGSIVDEIKEKSKNDFLALCADNSCSKNPNRWISVSEKLPDCDVECLVVDKDEEYGVGFYREDAKAWDSPNWGWLEIKDRVDNKEIFTQPCGIGKVIAWMPLPEAYNKEMEK